MSINWQSEMMYKYHYWVLTISEFLFQFVSIAFVYFLFSTNNWNNIAGLSIYDFYFVYVISDLVMTLMLISVYPSTTRMKNQVHKGNFDMNLIKPKSWFMVHFQRSWMAAGFQRFIYQIILFCLVYNQTTLEYSFLNIWLLIFLFVNSLAMMYLIYWNAVYLYLFYPKFDAVFDFVRTADEYNQYPSKIYPREIQWFFSFIVPVFLVVNPIYKLIDGTLDMKYIGGMMLVLLVFVLVNTWMWREGLRRYQSAA